MTWTLAKAAARRVFPKLSPTRPAGFALTTEGPVGVLIPCHDQDVVVVVTGKDLQTLKGMIEQARYGL